MLETIALVAAVAAGAAAIRHFAKKGEAETEEAWRVAAHRVGGEVEVGPSRWLGSPHRVLSLRTREGIDMTVRSEERGSGNAKVIVTKLSSTRLEGGLGTRITCERRDLVRVVARKLGIGERPTLDERFDEAVHMSAARPASVALAFLDAPTRLLVQSSGGGFDLCDGVLVVEREGEPRSPEPLVAMVRFAEALVARWAELASAPGRLATRLGLTAEPLRSLERGEHRAGTGVLHARPARLVVRVHDELLLTVLVIEVEGDASDPWTLEPDPDGTLAITGGLPPEAVTSFASTAPTCLLGLRRAENRLELAFDGLALDAETVRGCFEAVSAATTAASPYR